MAVDLFLNRTGPFLASRPGVELLDASQRNDLANLFGNYGKELLKIQREETGEHVASGAVSLGSLAIAVIDGSFLGGVVSASIGAGAWVRNGASWLKWRGRKRELEFFDDWISSLVTSS